MVRRALSLGAVFGVIWIVLCALLLWTEWGRSVREWLSGLVCRFL